MLKQITIFTLVAFLIAPARPAISDIKPLGLKTAVSVKPGAEIKNSILRSFRKGKISVGVFGALAVSSVDSSKWYATEGMTSAKAAAAVAKATCDTKFGSEGMCQVVAVRVPAALSGSYSEIMQASGISTACEREWASLRRKGYRPVHRVGECYVKFETTRKRGKNDTDPTLEAGNSLVIARNSFKSDVLIYGQFHGSVAAEALEKYRLNHEAILRGASVGDVSRTANWNSRTKDLKFEGEAMLAVNKANPKLGTCSIVHHEILP